MATEKIPLNLYKRVTRQLKRVPESVYEAPSERASTFISTIATNTTNENRILTLAVSSFEESVPKSTTLLSDITLTPKEYTNVLPSKLVIGEGDNLIASADIEDLVTTTTPGLFWLYDLPSELTEVDLQVGFTTSTQITANFNIGNISLNQRAFNGDFSDWTGWIESFPGSNTTIERSISSVPTSPPNVANIQGPAGYVMGLSLLNTQLPLASAGTGTVSIKKQTSTLEELQLFGTQYYPRVQLTNIDPRAAEVVDPTTTPLISTMSYEGAGLLLRSSASDPIANATTAPISVNYGGSDLFGRQVKISAWMRASSATKIVIEVPFTGPPGTTPTSINYGTQNNYTIVNLTTAWTKYEALFTLPTFDEYWLSAYSQITNSTYSLTQLSGGFTTYVYPSVDPSLKTQIPLSAYTVGASFRFRYPYLNTYRRRVGDSVASTNHLISTVNQALILNGYYDIANLEFFINTGSSFVPLTSFQTTEYLYDLSNDTDTNLTLSILESVNTP